jgi:phosphatidylinositol alpha-mannosyltransferase
MAGHVSAEDLPRYHASAHIYCAPNTGKESFGIVLLEAMAAGLPVVATDIDGFSQLIAPGRQGILVRRDDPVSLASAINLLADDPELRVRLGRAGRRMAAEYSWDRVVDRVIDVYGQSLGHVKPRIPGFLESLGQPPFPSRKEDRESVHDAIPGLG